MGEIVDEIDKSIKWLDDRVKSEDIIGISMVVDKLAIQSMYFSSQVSDAYELMSKAEDDYKHSCAEYIRSHTGSKARAEIEAEVEYKAKKEHWTDMKCIYKKLDTYLDRLDKIIEAYRQRVSVIKQASMKNLSSGI